MSPSSIQPTKLALLAASLKKYREEQAALEASKDNDGFRAAMNDLPSSIIPTIREQLANIPVPAINLNAPPWKEQFPAPALSSVSALISRSISISEKLEALRKQFSSTSSSIQESSSPETTDTDTTDTDTGINVAELAHRLSDPNNHAEQTTDKYGHAITYNDKQSAFIKLAGIEGNSAVLIGAAGTGKTTCQKGVVNALIDSGKAGLLEANGHKHLISGNPGIVICAYTRRAVANIRKNVSSEMQNNCITIHKLLEYQPVYYEVYDDNTGNMKNTMRFEATRNSINTLPSSIRTIIFEESSMLGTDLYKEVINACPHNPQLIFLGDIQQLPPVFGPAILGFKLLELPVIELTEVYRQALESPIISLAHRVLSGNPIPATSYGEWKHEGKLTIHPWKKKIDAQNALNTAGMFFTAAADKGVYDPEEDIILIPFNKAFGTDELNKIIANHLAHKRNAYIYEIIAGFQKIYLSTGDKVLYDKEDAIILEIQTNPAYSGPVPQTESLTMDYWGFESALKESHVSKIGDVDFLLAQVASTEERVNQSSHIVVLKMLDSDTIVRVQTAGDMNSLLLGYALTVHKSQGSEWRKVFFITHQSHATMLQRELLYTAITRAKEELYIICEPEMFTKGITSQRVKGNTLEEKAEYFKGKVTSGSYEG